MLANVWLLFRRVVQEYGDDNCSHMAAAISYYVLFSIVPLTIFLVSVFGLVVRDRGLQEDVADEVVEFLDVEAGVPTIELARGAIEERYGADGLKDIDEALMGLTDEQKQELAATLGAGDPVTIAGRSLGAVEVSAHPDNAVIDTIRGVSEVSGALTVVGLLGMLWSASAMFGAVRKSLNQAWDVEAHRPVVQQKALDLAMVLGLGLLLVVSIAGTAALRTVRQLSDDNLGPLSTGTGAFWSVVPFVLPAVFSFAVFILIYRYVPNVTHTIREVWPGALLATVLFEILKNGYALYIANFNNYAGAYGALGGILLFLLWTYVTANILLIGAELASEYSRLRRGELAPAPPASVGPRPTLVERARTFVRGLVFHDRPAREASGDDAAPGHRSHRT